MASRGIKDRVAIIGMGCTKFGEHWDKGTEDLLVEASYDAYESAGVDPDDIDAYWLGTMGSGVSGLTLSEPLKIQYKPVTRVENMCATGSEALRQASADLLATMPNFNTFEDRLTMEFRRAVAAELKLSVLVISIKLNRAISEPSLGVSALGDAAKAISRKLREQDSTFLLKTAFFGVILPGVGQSGVQRVITKIAEGLSDAAGANDRFSYKIDAISYPEQISSAHDLELVVGGWLPETDSKQETLKDANVYN